MNRIWRVMAALLLLVVLAGVLGAQGPAEAGTRIAAGSARFVTCDISIDSGAAALGAWQIDWSGSIAGGSVELVGVEGGEPGAYAQPAYYDPEALTHGRVVLGAFSTAKPDGLPRGKTRVARLHLRVVADEPNAKVEMTTKVMAAADGDGKTIEPKASAALGDNP